MQCLGWIHFFPSKAYSVALDYIPLRDMLHALFTAIHSDVVNSPSQQDRCPPTDDKKIGVIERNVQPST